MKTTEPASTCASVKLVRCVPGADDSATQPAAAAVTEKTSWFAVLSGSMPSRSAVVRTTEPPWPTLTDISPEIIGDTLPDATLRAVVCGLLLRMPSFTTQLMVRLGSAPALVGSELLDEKLTLSSTDW